MLLAENIHYFLKTIKPSQHVGLFYDTLDAKHSILFDYLSEGLNNGKELYTLVMKKPGMISDVK